MTFTYYIGVKAQDAETGLHYKAYSPHVSKIADLETSYRSFLQEHGQEAILFLVKREIKGNHRVRQVQPTLEDRFAIIEVAEKVIEKT